ncbi:MAG: hypothetical protein WBG71_10395 [Leeuwenhoekiella sp.]
MNVVLAHFQRQKTMERTCLFLICYFLVCSFLIAQSQNPEVPNNLIGTYEGKWSTPEGIKYARFMICKGENIYSGGQQLHNIIMKRSYYDNKNFKIKLEASFITGVYYSYGKEIGFQNYSYINVLENDNYTIEPYYTPNLYFVWKGNKLTFPEGTLRKISDSPDCENLSLQVSKALIKTNTIPRTKFLPLIYNQARISVRLGQDHSIGVQLGIDLDQDLEQQLNQKTLEAWYSYDDKYFRKGSDYDVRAVRKQILGAMQYFDRTGVNLGRLNWLRQFKNASEIEVFNRRSKLLDFRILVSRDSDLNFKVVTVDLEKSLKGEVQSFDNIAQSKERERQRSIQEQGQYGYNASGEIIDLYNPNTQNRHAVYGDVKMYYYQEEIINLYYGKFGKINRSAFPLLLNMFLIKSSRKFGENVAEKSVISNQRLIQTTVKTSGGISYPTDKPQNIDYKIYLEPRFLSYFEKNLNADQFTVGRDGQTRQIDVFLNKYNPSTLVYKQLSENMYRYITGQKAATTIDEIQH